MKGNSVMCVNTKYVLMGITGLFTQFPQKWFKTPDKLCLAAMWLNLMRKLFDIIEIFFVNLCKNASKQHKCLV